MPFHLSGVDVRKKGAKRIEQFRLSSACECTSPTRPAIPRQVNGPITHATAAAEDQPGGDAGRICLAEMLTAIAEHLSLADILAGLQIAQYAVAGIPSGVHWR
jgi:hypothetical protein